MSNTSQISNFKKIGSKLRLWQRSRFFRSRWRPWRHQLCWWAETRTREYEVSRWSLTQSFISSARIDLEKDKKRCNFRFIWSLTVILTVIFDEMHIKCIYSWSAGQDQSKSIFCCSIHVTSGLNGFFQPSFWPEVDNVECWLTIPNLVA